MPTNPNLPKDAPTKQPARGVQDDPRQADKKGRTPSEEQENLTDASQDQARKNRESIEQPPQRGR